MSKIKSLLIKIKSLPPVNAIYIILNTALQIRRRALLLKTLSEIVKCKEVLVIGSAPSYIDINEFIKNNPQILKVCVNLSIRKIPLNSKIDIHSITSHSAKETGISIKEIQKAYEVTLCISNKHACNSDMFCRYNYEDLYAIFYILGAGGALKLFVKTMLDKSSHMHPSQGMQLIALLKKAGAKQIYAVGFTAEKQSLYDKHTKYPNASSKANRHYLTDSAIWEALSADKTVYKMDRI